MIQFFQDVIKSPPFWFSVCLKRSLKKIVSGPFENHYYALPVPTFTKKGFRNFDIYKMIFPKTVPLNFLDLQSNSVYASPQIRGRMGPEIQKWKC